MDSARCRPVVVECNLWASCGEPPPLFVVERCSFALCFPLFFLFSFLLKMDRFVLWAWRMASSFFFSCLELGLCLLLQSSSHFLVAWQPFVPRLFDTVSNTSGAPFNNQPIEGELSPFLLSQALFVLLFQSGIQTHGNTFCLFFVFVLIVVV